MAATADYQAEIDFLFGRINYERTPTGDRNALKVRSMVQLMELLDNAHRGIRTVHVAGTKGKGSVATMIARNLSAAGRRVGLYTSPHLETVRERIQVDEAMVTEQQLATALCQVRAAVGELDRRAERDPAIRRPTFFEVITAAAFVHFQQVCCQWTVLEVGLGGRLDSTNVCQPDLCVITNISLDHTKQLGNTLALIAQEKAGIIKPGIPVVCGLLADEAREVIEDIADKHDAPVLALTPDHWREHPGHTIDLRRDAHADRWELEQVTPGLRGRHQFENAGIAYLVSRHLMATDSALQLPHIRRGIEQASLKGRMEVIGHHPWVILDMAHNPASAEALARALRSSNPRIAGQRRVLIFASSRDKDIPGILTPLVPLFDHLICTRFVNNPRAAEPEGLARLATDLANPDHNPLVETAATPEQAWHRAIHSIPVGDSSLAEPLCKFDLSIDNSLICVAGSAFLCGEIRPLAIRAATPPPHTSDCL